MKNDIITSNVNYYDNSYLKAKDVMLSEDKTTITVLNTSSFYNYTLYNLKTELQAQNWVNGSKGTVVFTELDPKEEYGVRVQSRQDIQPMPIIKPEVIINPTIPLFGADLIIPVKAPTFNDTKGCGMITIKADSEHGYAILNENNQALSDKELKKWGIKVTDDKGHLLPKTDDGYFFGCNKNMTFEVPAGGEFKMGGKNLKKKYTFVNGPTFITPGLYYNAWYIYLPSYYRAQQGSYALIINPACRNSVYKAYNLKGIYQKSTMVKGENNIIVFKDIDPANNYVIGSALPLKDSMH